jgi:hypothetical protein
MRKNTRPSFQAVSQVATHCFLLVCALETMCPETCALSEWAFASASRAQRLIFHRDYVLQCTLSRAAALCVRTPLEISSARASPSALKS